MAGCANKRPESAQRRDCFRDTALRSNDPRSVFTPVEGTTWHIFMISSDMPVTTQPPDPQQRNPEGFLPLHVICMDTRDSPKDAVEQGKNVRRLCKQVCIRNGSLERPLLSLRKMCCAQALEMCARTSSRRQLTSVLIALPDRGGRSCCIDASRRSEERGNRRNSVHSCVRLALESHHEPGTYPRRLLVVFVISNKRQPRCP